MYSIGKWQEATTRCLRNVMRRHYNVQRCLNFFNDVFALFIVLFLLQCFFMIVILFYMNLRPDATFEHHAQIVLFGGNCVQYFVRCTLVLHFFGQVSVSVKAIRDILLIDVGVESISTDSGLMREVTLFVGRADEVCVSAGNYLFFSTSFLLSFYGILTTYIAVLVQSF